MLQNIIITLSFFSFISNSIIINNNQYNIARNIRTIQGHEAAIPYYKQLLVETHYKDTTAGVRIASGIHSPNRHDKTCVYEDSNDVKALRELLLINGYTTKIIGKLFGVFNTDISGNTVAPLYVKSIIPNGNHNYKSPDVTGSAVKCLVSLFLLGHAST